MPRSINNPNLYSGTLFDECHRQLLPLAYPNEILSESKVQNFLTVVDLTDQLIELAHEDYSQVFKFNSEQGELIVCRLFERAGHEVERVSNKATLPDGGIDIVARPLASTFPMFFAIQVKWNQPGNSVEPGFVREFCNVITRNSVINAGYLVTTTSFTPTSYWEQDEYKQHKYLKLRDHKDLARWIAGKFLCEQEWREVPHRFQYAPGKYARLPRPFSETYIQQLPLIA